MLNKIVVMGRLVNDPDLRVTQTNKQVCSFKLACDRDFAVNGEKVTDFIDCVVWNAGAEFVSRNFSKGKWMAVIGRMQSKKWKDSEGKNRTGWYIAVENAHFCGDKPITKATMEELPDDGDLPF